MTMPDCPVCESAALQASVIKAGVPYLACLNCRALFSGEIATAVLITHNDGPVERNQEERQATRLQRLVDHLGRMPQHVLDFGCGRGSYVDYLQTKNIAAVGVDQDTDIQIGDFAPRSFDVINMVEVIEHLTDPRSLLTTLIALLKKDGIMYIESSFVDYLGDPANSDYIDPRIGHCCIHSVKSIAILADHFSVRPVWINNNVVVLHK